MDKILVRDETMRPEFIRAAFFYAARTLFRLTPPNSRPPIRFQRTPRRFRDCHPIFQIDTQAICDAIDVIKVRNNLRRDRDLVITEADLP
jgi:hypothetical protein